MYYKNAFFDFIKIFCAIIVVMVAVIYVSDPFMIFHKKLWNKDKIYTDMRVQDYGLVKYMDFDNFILGSSMLENTSAYEANERLGGKWINLSFGGQRSYERFMVINWALQNHKINNVIVSLDDHSFNPRHIESTFEPKLYENDFDTKWKVYFKSNAMTCVFLGKHCRLEQTDVYNRPAAWINGEYYTRRFGGFDNWIKAEKDDGQIQDVFRMLLENNSHCDMANENYKQTIDTEIVPLFANTDTEFHVIIPPYSGLYWAYDFNNFDCRMRPYEYLIEQSQNYSNAHIYWLYDEGFVFDIDTYKDLTHHTDAINTLELDFIKNRSHVINVNNYKHKIQQFKNKVQKIDVKYYTDKIKEYYDKKGV